MISKLSKTLILRINLLLVCVSGLITLWELSHEPSEEQVALLFGFSLARLFVFSVIILVILFSVLVFLKSFSGDFWEGWIGRVIYNAFMGTWLPVLLLVLLLALFFFLLMSEQILGSLASYRERLYPLLLWLGGLPLQFFLTILLLRLHSSTFLCSNRDALLKTLLVFFVLGLLVLFISVSRVGLTPDVVYWQEAGVPLLIEQVLFAVGGGMTLAILINKTERFAREKSLSLPRGITPNLVLSVAIWGGASVAWLLQPHRYSYNFLLPKPPNFQSYPFGDSIYYDIHSQYNLIGVPLPSHFWVKPLYTFFLSILHALGGYDYALIVTLQVLVLAIIPSLVFFLVNAIGNRPAGLVAALLVILRERNAIALSNIIQVSNVRLLMSDVFSMGLMVLLLLIIVIWLKRPPTRRVTSLAAGGVLGLLVLTRGHPIVLLPFIFLIAIFAYLHNRSSHVWKRDFILLCVGFLLPLAPWFWRNYEQTGRFTLQNSPVTYMGQLANLYSENPSVGHGNLLPGETVTDFQARVQRQMREYVIQHPEDVFRFVSAHYFHNLILSYVYLPQSFQVQGLRAYVKSLPFWGNWQGELKYGSQVLLVINLLVLSAGFISLWKKNYLFALAPIVLALGYNMSVSVSRLSGWRFIIPSDWIILVYYSIGLVQVMSALSSLLNYRSRKSESSTTANADTLSPPQKWKPMAFVMATLLLMTGLGVTKGHALFPARYPKKTQEELYQAFMQMSEELPPELSENTLRAFLAQEDAVIAYGRALYPSFLSPKEGAWNIFWPVFKQNPYDRIAFHLIGPEDLGVLLPIEPAYDPASLIFPDGVDVVALGCRQKTDYVDYIDALAVIVGMQPKIVYIRSSLSGLTCPLTPP